VLIHGRPSFLYNFDIFISTWNHFVQMSTNFHWWSKEIEINRYTSLTNLCHFYSLRFISTYVLPKIRETSKSSSPTVANSSCWYLSLLSATPAKKYDTLVLSCCFKIVYMILYVNANHVQPVKQSETKWTFYMMSTWFYGYCKASMLAIKQF
jgi:hypothetical protein